MDAVEVLIVLSLSVLLVFLGLMAIICPTDPYNDSFRLCAVGGAIIGLLLKPMFWGE